MPTVAQEPHRTSNLFEAAYLLGRGYQLAGKHRLGRRTVVLFQWTQEIQQAAMDYYAGAVMEARQLAEHYRGIKDFIFADRTEQEESSHGHPSTQS